MKAFNLRLAKQGHPVCTRDGHKVRIVCWDYNSVVHDNRPIIALISEGENEVAVVRGLDGKVSQNEESNLDLMMDMDDWGLGYKYAVDKACKWLNDNLPLYCGQVNADNTDRFVRILRKAMEEQQ